MCYRRICFERSIKLVFDLDTSLSLKLKLRISYKDCYWFIKYHKSYNKYIICFVQTEKIYVCHSAEILWLIFNIYINVKKSNLKSTVNWFILLHLEPMVCHSINKYLTSPIINSQNIIYIIIYTSFTLLSINCSTFGDNLIWS